MVTGQRPPTRRWWRSGRQRDASPLPGTTRPLCRLGEAPTPAGECQGKLAGTTGWKGSSVSERAAGLSSFSEHRAARTTPDTAMFDRLQPTDNRTDCSASTPWNTTHLVTERNKLLSQATVWWASRELRCLEEVAHSPHT